jgi:hypothetical protein
MWFAKQTRGIMGLFPSYAGISKALDHFPGYFACTSYDSLPKDGMPLGVVQAKMTGQDLWGTESPSSLIRSIPQGFTHQTQNMERGNK